MTALALKLYGLVTKENSVTVFIDLEKVFSLKNEALNLIKKLLKKSFLNDFYNLFSGPVK